MTIIKLILLSGIVVFSACPKYRPAVNFKNPGGLVNELNAHLKDAQHNYECYRFGPTHIDAQGESCAGFAQDLNKAKAVRNELLENAIHHTEHEPLVCKGRAFVSSQAKNVIVFRAKAPRPKPLIRSSQKGRF